MQAFAQQTKKISRILASTALLSVLLSVKTGQAFAQQYQVTLESFLVNFSSNNLLYSGGSLLDEKLGILVPGTVQPGQGGSLIFVDPDVDNIGYGAPQRRGIFVPFVWTVRTGANPIPVPANPLQREKVDGFPGYVFQRIYNLNASNSYLFRITWAPFPDFSFNNLDGKHDPYYVNISNLYWESYSSDNSICNSLGGYGNGGNSPDVPIPGRWTIDSLTKRAVYRPSTRAFYINGGAAVVYGNSGDIPVVEDWNGDGITDVALWRPSTAAWYYRPTPTGGDVSLGVYGISTDQPLPADYDGDGKADRALHRVHSSGYYYEEWYIALSSGGSQYYTSSPSPGSGSKVIPTGFPLPGDYDGDGKVDPATVYVDSNFTLSYFSSASNSLQTKVFYAANSPSGFSGPLQPVVGDFDGDGKQDPGVFYYQDPYNGNTSRIRYLPSSGGGYKDVARSCGFGTNTIVNFNYVGRNFYISPVLIDTNGDGFKLTDVDNGVVFDFGGYGAAVNSSWTQAESDDAFLALDRNKNGTIDNGSELFGNHTQQIANLDPNGFLALSVFDTRPYGGNNDGVIDRKDAVFNQLRLWFDFNHDATSQPEELLTLGSKGIAKLSLNYKASRYIDEYGNRFRYRSRIYDGQGAQNGRWAWDVFFAITTRN